MTTDKQQRQALRANSLWIGLLALTSSLSAAQDNSQLAEEDAAPWYQVEVVVFTQQGYTGAEQPPRRYKLDFPQNNLDLLEPGQISDNDFPVAGNGVVSTTAARIIPLATIADPALSLSAEVLPGSEVENPEQQDIEQNSPFDEYDLAQLNAQDAAFLASNPIGTSVGTSVGNQTQTAEQAYVAEYEPTFVKLPRDVRNLN